MIKGFSCCIIFLAIFAVRAGVVYADTPSFFVSEHEYDFGTITEGETITHDFIVTNLGTAPLVFDASGTCDCTTLEISSTEIRPGATASIRFVYDSTGVDGVEQQVLNVVTNDPIFPQTTLVLRGYVDKTFVISPSILVFETIERDGQATEHISISATDLPGELKISQVVTLQSELSAAVNPGNNAQEKIVEVTLDAFGVPAGRFRGAIQIHTNHPNRSIIDVPVEADIQGSLVVDPPRLMMRRVSTDEGGSAEVSVLSMDEVTLFRVTGVEYQAEVGDQPEFQYQSGDAAQSTTISVTIPAGTPPGALRGKATVLTDNPNQPTVSFTINVQIR